MNNQTCIFCKIARGEAEAERVFENEAVVAFLAKDPVARGHVLVIPKEHCENITDISSEALEKVMEVVRDLAKKGMVDEGATGVNLLHAAGKDAQQSVFHFHMHIVPRFSNDGLDLWFREGIEGKEK